MRNKPLKRNENIQPLSREHHHGLLFCWKIKTGLKKDIEVNRIIKYVEYFYNAHLKSHFKEEEVLLFDKVKHEMCDEAQKDHWEISELVTKILSGENDIRSNLVELSNKVDDHIRFEERKLFPFLEETLTEADLTKIGEQLSRLHALKSTEQFNDEFWV